MATRTFEQDFSAFTNAAGEDFSAIRLRVGAGLNAMGPYGRRFALTGLGAMIALGLGAATASAFRLPSEVTDPVQPQDQTLAQSELPSDAAARAYALENPPVYSVKDDQTDDAATADPALAVDTTKDETPTLAAYNGDNDVAEIAPSEKPSPSASQSTSASTANP